MRYLKCRLRSLCFSKIEGFIFCISSSLLCMKQTILSAGVRQVLQDYSAQYQQNKWWTFCAFIAPAFGNIFIFLVPPLIVAKLMNTYIATSLVSVGAVGGLIALFAASWLFGEVLWRFSLHYLIKLEAQAVGNLNKLAFHRLAERDYDFYTNNFVGSLTKKAAAFSRSFEIFNETLIFNIFTNVIPIVFVSIVLWRYSPWIPLILIACLGLVVVVALPIIRCRSRLVAERHEAGSKMVGRLADALTNMFAIKSFAKEHQEERVYSTCVDEYALRFKKAANFQNLRFETVISPLYVATNVIGLVITVFFTQRFHLPPGAMFVIFSYYAQVTRIFWDLNRIYRNIESSLGEAAEFTELLLLPPIIQDIGQPKKLVITAGEITFNNVCFTYGSKESDESFLEDFSLHIKGNEKVGLVGPSGSGKTTITRLLLRFMDVNSGSIMVDGQDVRSAKQSSLREAIAYVPQEPFLFHRTLFENIAYGDERATKNDVVRAAKLAHAHEFIVKLPHQYDTLVGERGVKLSGGQRQRVVIARALIKNSPILVLDEATSSLDSESEKYIQDGLKQLMENKTALVIAHRLSTIKNLDRIIVLDRGRIVQAGSHGELIRQNGLYAKLWSHQSGEFFS